MKVDKKTLPKAQMEFLVELSVDELKPYLQNATEEIASHRKIEGFRPGKAPYEIVVREVGEMFVYQTTANFASDAIMSKILAEEKIEIVDQPKIEVQKLAPGNPFIFKATVALVPEIKVCEYGKVKVKPMQEIKIEDKEIERVMTDLQKMRAKEALADKAVEKGDKVELDFDTFVDNVAIEHGHAKKHALVIGEGRMIPGFEEELIGLKAGDAKEFELAFPKEYHEKSLAGKKATFKVKVTAVFKIELPKLDNEFAIGLGFKEFADLKKHIEADIRHEKERKEEQRMELELINALIDKSTFGEIPEVLINEETHKMFHELEDNVSREGLKFEDYLQHIKKTEGDLRLDFVPDAIKRVKTGLLIRHVAKLENIQADDQEIEAEIERSLASYKFHPAYADKLPELEKNMRSENARPYFANMIANRKTLELLKDKVLEKDRGGSRE